MSPDDWQSIDGGTSPRARDDVASVSVDADAVLYDPVTGRAHVLNASAALIWSQLDGVATIASLARALSDAVGADPAHIESQIVSLVRDLARRGVVDGVRGEPQPEDGGC